MVATNAQPVTLTTSNRMKSGRLRVVTSTSSPSSQRITIKEDTMKTEILTHSSSSPVAPASDHVSPTTGRKLNVTKKASHWIRDHLPVSLSSPNRKKKNAVAAASSTSIPLPECNTTTTKKVEEVNGNKSKIETSINRGRSCSDGSNSNTTNTTAISGSSVTTATTNAAAVTTATTDATIQHRASITTSALPGTPASTPKVLTKSIVTPTPSSKPSTPKTPRTALAKTYNTLISHYTQRYGALRGCPVVLFTDDAVTTATTTVKSSTRSGSATHTSVICWFEYSRIPTTVQQISSDTFQITATVYRIEVVAPELATAASTDVTIDSTHEKTEVVSTNNANATTAAAASSSSSPQTSSAKDTSSIPLRIQELNRMLYATMNTAVTVQLVKGTDVTLSLSSSMYQPRSRKGICTASSTGGMLRQSITGNKGGEIPFHEFCTLLDNFMNTATQIHRHFHDQYGN